MSLKHALDFFAAIGVLGWIGFAISLIGIGASAADAFRTWPDKKDDHHWRFLTSIRILALFCGAAISALGAGLGNMKSNVLQLQLDSTQQVAAAAQVGVNQARTDLAKLGTAAAALAAESQAALDQAQAEGEHAKRISAEVARIDTETQARLVKADAVAKRAAFIAAHSQVSAQRAAADAARSGQVALSASESARASREAALAAAVKAHVYRLPDQAIVEIEAALRGVKATTTSFIACHSGLEEVCGQLAVTFRTAGLDPNVHYGESFWSGGYDANPLARTENPNVTVGYMAGYARPARDIIRALTLAGLHAQADAFPPNTLGPNLEINFIYVGSLP